MCTTEEFAALTEPGTKGLRRPVDFRNDLLPLLFAEMQARYHIHSALLRGGVAQSSSVRRQLRAAWLDGHYDKVVEEFEIDYGRFDPSSHIFAGSDRRYTSSADYEAQVYDIIETDLNEALTEGGSPVKAAQEVLRNSPRPAALRHRVRRTVTGVVHRLPVERSGSYQSA